MIRSGLMRPSTALWTPFLLAATTAIGCASDGDGGEAPPAGDEVPPRESGAMEAWLADAPYLGWTCEPELRPPVDPSPHGEARVCQNQILLDADGDGEFPPGAASVKEQGSGGSVSLVSVVVRATTGGGGESWYWWRKDVNLDLVVVDAFGAAECASCHQDAERDFVFTLL